MNNKLPVIFPDSPERWCRKRTQEQRAISGIDNTTEQYYVAGINGEVVGCGGYYLHQDTYTAGMTWGLVHRDFQGRGIGKQLLLYRISMIRKISPHCTIKLDTSQHSAPFFGKRGFAVTHITPDFYGPGLDRYDMALKA
ncbi:MAG TPA: GNAT family N-acetyltransferase [Chitinophaga sp.]|uniref:GNAT family N-acetyltransferase n=1 Tax=Chitinophaga sp. TaxID=1869181 RepID=UPI002C0D622E|nr:GNAT family N-acetyltransferase [Chitinophaga sp.]HVI44986.1 GNAT family N-acetyltransferase [Chitinophaga sp.]